MARRGENIRERKDGRWEARYRFGEDKKGNPKYLSVYGKTYSEAKRKRNDRLKDMKSHLSQRDKQMTLEKALFLWISAREIKVREQTYAKYLYLIEKHIVPEIGSKRIYMIEAECLNEFLKQKKQNGRLDKKGGLSINTVRSLAFILKSALAYAAKKGIKVPLNNEVISISTSSPINAKKKRKVLTAKEQEQLEGLLLHNPDGTKLGMFLCLHAGLRIGEICGLQWSDIDFEEGIIHIRKAVERIRNKEKALGGRRTSLVVGDVKTSSSVREIPIPSYLLPIIKRVYEKSDSVYLAKGKKHEYLDPRAYQYRLGRYLKKCNIKHVNFHALRHTFATRCMEKGVDVKSLSELLGHANVTITLNTYVHPSTESKRTQLELLKAI